MANSLEDRLVTLETLAAEQERTIGELSAELTRQWRTVETLRQRLDALADRFLALEAQTAPDAPVTRPPHW